MKESYSNLPEQTPEEKSFGLHLEQPIITDYDQFVVYLKDARNQFGGTFLLAKTSPDIFTDKSKKVRHLHLIEYLKTQNLTINDVFLKDPNVQSAISKYNELVDRLDSCESSDSFNKIFQDLENFVSGLEKTMFNFIRKDDQFWDTLSHFKKQFDELQNDFKSGISIEKILKRNEDRTYKTFEQLLGNEAKRLAKEFTERDKYTQPMSDFNDLAKRAKSFTTEAELKQIIEEVNEFLKK